MPADSDGPRRYLIAAAVAHYPKSPQWNRPALVEARDDVITLFTEDLGYQHVSTLGLDPTRDQLTTLLRTFCRDDARRPDDIVAVYIGSHGEVLEDSREHVILTADVDPDDVEDALPTAELARKILLGTRVRRAFLMLDTCYSGQGGNELAAAAITSMTRNWGDDHGSALVVITATQPSEQALVGAFPRLLRDAVRALPTAGYNPATLPLDSIVKAMNANVNKPAHQTIGYTVAGLTGEIPPFLPNPRHDLRMTDVDLAIQRASEFEVQAERRDLELRTRLLVRAMGGSSRGGGDWWFTGRHTALLDITAWLDHPARDRSLKVVTGNPGSGKTAVLGLVATLTHPGRRATVPLHALGLPAAAVPEPTAVDVAIYAQGLTTSQVLVGIAASAYSHAGTPGQLLEALAGRDKPLTVLIDALDEAADPDHLIRRLLRPLIEHSTGNIRLLVGTRDFLLDRLSLRREDAIDLDADRYADLPALTSYAARGLLEASLQSPYLDESPPLIRAVADAVAEAAYPSFLVARITSATLAAEGRVADPHDPAWRRTLPRLPGDAMHRDLETRLGDNAAKVRDLLRPLAFAEGQGLPWEDIWAAVASRVVGTAYTDDDLLWLRKHAGSYVVEATESGRSTYRLYHQALADHLRSGVDAGAMHNAIAEVLVTRIPRTLEGHRDWTRAHPYTVRHLATHAAHAGQLDALITDVDYLVVAEPSALLFALHQTTTAAGALTAAVYRCSADIHRHLSTSRRRQVLAVDAARFRAHSLQHDLSTTLAWKPRWATGRQADHALHTTFTGHTAWVTAVACSVLDGRPVAVTSGDNTAWVWDLDTGDEITTFTNHHVDLVRAVACSDLSGRPVAVTASDSTAWVWDLATGGEIASIEGHAGSVWAVACSILDGRPVAVTGDTYGIARVWDLATGGEITTFVGHTGSVRVVACSILDGRPVAVTGDTYGIAWVWDLATGDEVSSFTGQAGSVRAVACGTLGSRPVTVTAEYNAVRVRDLATGEEITTFTGHTGSVRAVACSTLDGHSVAVTADDNNTARVWDLASGEEITTFTGHTGSVKAVACSTLDGQPVVVTADGNTARVWQLPLNVADLATSPGHSADIFAEADSILDGRPVVVTAGDDTVMIWDLANGDEIADLTVEAGSVRALTCSVLDGRPVAVTADASGIALVWELATGDEITSFTGHAGSVGAVACSNLDGRPLAVTVAAYGGTARVWDVATGDEITSFRGHIGSVRAVACSTLYGRPVAVTADASGTAFVWDLVTGGEIITFTGHTGSVRAVACSTLDGHPVAVTAGDDTALVWDLATGDEIITFTGHTGSVRAVACSTLNGRSVAITAGDDDTVRVWDLATGERMAIFDFRNVGCIATGTGGELVIATGWDIVVLGRVAKH
jgi:WD40 repeat protein